MRTAGETQYTYDGRGRLATKEIWKIFPFEVPKSSGNNYDYVNYTFDYRAVDSHPLYATTSDTLYCRMTFTYDSNGDNIEVTYYDADSNVGGKEIFEYYAEGNIKTEEIYRSSGTIRSKTIYTINGSIDKYVNFDDGGHIMTSEPPTYKTTKETAWESLAQQDNSYLFTRMLVHAGTSYDSDTRYEYQTDSIGNWKKKTYYRRTINDDAVVYEEPILIFERSITYYD